MRHVSCDICTRDLLPGTDARYSVTIEGQLVCEPAEWSPVAELGSELDIEPDTDCIDEMDEILTDLSEDDTVDEATELALPVPPMSRTFDLCGRCYRRFAGDPLARTNRVLSFSAN